MKNPCVIFVRPRQVIIEDRDIPRPEKGQLLVEVSRSLISTGTELTILAAEVPEGSHWSKYTRDWPKPSGYCTLGQVIDVGEGVDRQWIGKKVAGYGNHARYTTYDQDLARLVHRPIKDDEAVFATMAEIAFNGVRRSQLAWGESAAVNGLGVLGQLAVRICRLAGAFPVFALDVIDARIQRLPHDPLIVPINPRQQDLLAMVTQRTRGRKVDVAIEFSGNQQAIPELFKIVREMGRVTIASSPRGPITFNFHDLCSACGITIIGAPNWGHPPVENKLMPWTKHRHVELFFDWVADGQVDVAPLISHLEPYANAPALYQMLLADRSQAMGVVLNWD